MFLPNTIEIIIDNGKIISDRGSNTWPSSSEIGRILKRRKVLAISVTILFCFETLKIIFWKDIRDERGQRTEKNWMVPVSGKRWRKSNLRFAASASSLRPFSNYIKIFREILLNYKKEDRFFVRLSRNPFFFYRGKFISKKKYTLTFLYSLFSPPCRLQR